LPVVVETAEPAPGPPRELTDRTLREYAFDAAHHRRRMGEILVAAGAIGQTQLSTALQRQESEPTRRLGTILVELGATTEIMIARVLAAQLQLPFTELSEDDISDQAVSLVTARLVRNHRTMPMRATNDAIVLAMSNPLDLIAIEDIELATGRRVEVVVATASQVAAAIETFYGPEVTQGGSPARQP
jgi:type IV pilus assembly protein PilB